MSINPDLFGRHGHLRGGETSEVQRVVLSVGTSLLSSFLMPSIRSRNLLHSSWLAL